ncbi:MAG TPA: radical SAM family heme chaperone HemW [Gemmatimonadaceae bacterium]|nr:radical SAM family heme chaperone HemW [Gemmatimonadaceae bacterium]
MSNTARHLYVHVPFCARRCSYCDFAIAVRRDLPIHQYLDALSNELALRLAGGSLDVDTVYLGGGTPSLLGPEGIQDLLTLLRRHVTAAPNAEVTIEANPEDVTDDSVAAWQKAGITRVSLGIQSFEPRVLEWMHRVHDAATARHAAGIIARAGLASWSLDLIFALPDHLERDWEGDLDQALALDPPHISAYGLTVEPHTALSKWVARGAVAEAPEQNYEAQFLATHERLVAAGLEHYEVSNYGRPRHESRHNSAYWTKAPYIGVGPSAHSFDGRERRWNTREYQAWAAQAAAGIDPMAGSEVLTVDQGLLEDMYLGLRSSSGVGVDQIPPEIVEKWREQGWAQAERSRVRLTPQGWLRLDALVSALTADSNHC